MTWYMHLYCIAATLVDVLYCTAGDRVESI